MDQAVVTSEKTEGLEGAATMKKAVFSALQGRWQLTRTLRSSIPSYPSGKLTGTALLEKRPTTGHDTSEECLYSEEGDFTTDKNLTMRARRQYVYRYQQNLDRLTVWFVKPDDSCASVDYLFHCLDFADDGERLRESESDGDETILNATGHHLCVNDDYTAQYRFTFCGEELTKWSVKYIVKGPSKNYIADASYTRSGPVLGHG